MRFTTLALGALAFAGFAAAQGDVTALARRGETTIFLPAPTTPTSCNSGSTLRTGEGYYRDCNYFDMTKTPRPPLECTATVASYIDCHSIPTGNPSSSPSGGRSQRFVAQEALPTSNDTGGRSQRYVAREAMPTCLPGVACLGQIKSEEGVFTKAPILQVPTHLPSNDKVISKMVTVARA